MLLIYFLFLIFWSFQSKSLSQEISFWVVAVLLIHLLAFVSGIGFWLSYVVLSALILYRIFFSVRMSKKVIVQGALLALPFLLVMSMPTRFIDAGRYYDQSVRWFMNGVPAGLANFDLYFIQMSAVHSLEAVGNQISMQGQNLLTPLISLVILLRSFFENKSNINLYFFALLSLFFGGVVHFFQTSSSDLFLFSILTALFLHAEANKISPKAILCVGIIAPFLKLTALPVSILAGLFLLQHKAYKEIAILSFGMLLLVAKHIWLAGWLPVIGSVPVFWKIPENAASFITKSVAAYEAYNSKGYVLGRFRLPDLFVGVLYFITTLAYLKHFGVKNLIAIFSVLFFIFWVVVFPQGRYLLPIWFILLAQLSQVPLTISISPRKAFATVLVLGLTSTLVNWTHLFRNERIHHFLNFSGISNVNWISPHPLWVVETRAISIDHNFKYHEPVGNYQCFDSPFPCSANVGQYQEGDKRFEPVYFTEPFPHFRYREVGR